MRHTVTFGGKNTWTDWGLLAVKQPVIAPPPMKTRILELPGLSGEIDLSGAITGYPVFGNRTGQLNFIRVDSDKQFYPLVREISDYLHGQTTDMILSDEKNWYYEGRFFVDEPACDELQPGSDQLLPLGLGC